MDTHLTPLEIIWAIMSIASAFLTCSGFFLPYWIKGKLLEENDTSFGSFVRCGYPRRTDSGNLEFVSDCGRYSSFWAIPSHWWQATTIIAGAGATISLVTGLTVAISCCFADVVNLLSVKAAGALQLTSGVFIIIGLAIYPLGWGNKEVQDACSESSGPYFLGDCKISWSMYLLGSGIGVLLICFLLSLRACRAKKRTFCT